MLVIKKYCLLTSYVLNLIRFMIKGKKLFIFKSYLLKTQRKKSYLYKTILQFRLCSYFK